MAFDTQEASIADIDEAMRHIQNMLSGAEMTKSRRNILLESLDDLLEARFEITKTNEYEEATNGLGNGGNRELNARPE
jgi:pyrroloquinoline quinone (PQQ) biosynthesis protein C